MMKPEFFKPFNLEHAKAGAPFCGAGGESVRVLIWDRKHPRYPILAIEEDGDQEAIAFSADGIATHGVPGIVSELVMTPLGYIDGRPVFVGDVIERDAPDGWIPTTARPEDRDFTNARWQKLKMEYPKTQMTQSELEAAIQINDQTVAGRCRSVANSALRHAIDAGQVVAISEAKLGVRPHNPYTGALRDPRDIETDPMGVLIRHPDEPLRAIESRAARDMAIAKAVHAVCIATISGSIDRADEKLHKIDLESITASIG